MIRAVASVPPPAAHGTINVIGRSGYAACAAVANSSRPKTMAPVKACEIDSWFLLDAACPCPVATGAGLP